jgi:transcriptional accessory protein Tex/SPT6
VSCICDEGSRANEAAAVDILTSDFVKNPAVREQTREFIKDYGVVTVTPTDRGMSVIDHYHAYYVSILPASPSTCIELV